MGFLTPLFLVGLAGLAIPVLIHLIQREKKRVVQFPSLMFLQRIPYQSIRRRRIHNWALLIIRMAALAMIVAAFARPFLHQSQRVIATTGSREVVILLDRSYSMGFGDRWDRARAAARDAVNALRPDDRASLILFSSGAEVVVRSSSERPQLMAAIDAATLSAGSTRYAPALKVGGGILTESNLPRLEAILISDFQRLGWQGGDAAQLPAIAKLTPVAIQGGSDTPNLAVTGVLFERSTFTNQERVAVTAAVTNHSDRPLSNAGVELDLGGRAIQTEHVNVSPNGSASVTFAPITVNARDLRGTVKLGADSLERDNTFNFVLSPLEPLHLTVIDRAGSGDNSSLYLVRALSIGETPKFDVTVRTPDLVTEQDLTRSAVVLVNDVAVSPVLGDRLSRFVERGGGLFLALGPRSTWPTTSAESIPGSIGAPIDRSKGDAARLGAIEYGHQLFEVFRSPRSGDFSGVQFYGYRSVTPSPTGLVLARFDAGAPALIEGQHGRGRVLIWTSTVDLLWNDFALKPVFLPFVHGAMRHLAAYAEPAPWMTVGQVVDASGATAGATASPATTVAVTPSGRRVSVAEGGEGGLDVLELTEQGFYELRGPKSDTPTRVVASNVDVAESDLTPIDPKEIVAAAAAAPETDRTTAPAGAPLTAEAQERQQRVWWYLLWAGILLLGIDTVLSNRLSKA